MASGNRLRYSVSPNQIDDARRVPVSLEQRLFQAPLRRSRRLQRRVGGMCVSIRGSQPPDVEDEGKHMLMSKQLKRVVEWVSKARTKFEKEFPVFYREALARLLCLEHFCNLIETQALDAGTTVYTDHAPSTYVGSLSNKGRLSTWRIHETSDLTGIAQTLYKAGQYLGPGPYGGLADPLSRMPRGEQFHRLELPALLSELLQRLLDSVRTAHSIRVTAEKNTHLATRIVQRWRVPKNPISNVRFDNKKDFDFLIAAPFAEKVTHKVVQLIRERKKFAVLVAVDLFPQIKVTKAKEVDELVGQALLSMHAYHPYRTSCSGMAGEPPRLSAPKTRSCGSLRDQ
jgi:hypothetical protein